MKRDEEDKHLLRVRVLDITKILATGYIFSELRELHNQTHKSVGSSQIKHFLQDRQLVSIVVPTRNEAFHLPFLLTSLTKSWHKPLEVIIVDYLSSDKTVEIAKRFNAKVVHAKKRGVGYATHRGVLESNGEIVIRTDADAIFPPNLISDTVNIFRENETAKLYHVGHLHWDGNLLTNLMAHLYDKYWREIWKTTGHFIAFRKEIYNTVGGFDTNKIVDEDFDFGERVFQKKFQIVYDPNKVVLISARRIKKTGILNYILGKRIYH